MEIMIHSILSWITARIYIAPSAYESWFITDALSYEDLDFTIRAVDKVSKTF
jgi:glutamate-1-semialdehyde 2,1-aminomutase